MEAQFRGQDTAVNKLTHMQVFFFSDGRVGQ